MDEEAHATILDAFELSSEPDAEKAALVWTMVARITHLSLLQVADVVDGLLETFGIADESFGDWDPERGDSYVPPEELECEGVNPFVENVVDFVDRDR